MGSKSKSCSHTNKLILGAVLGSAIIGASTAFLNTKSGRRIRGNAADTIEDLKEKLEEFLDKAGDKAHSLSNSVGDCKELCSDKFHSFASQISEQIEALGTEDNQGRLTAFLIGGILGGMLGAGAASWSSDSNKKSDLVGTLSSSAFALKDTIKDILHVLNDDKDDKHERASAKSSKVNDVLDFAAAGLELWQKFQSRK